MEVSARAAGPADLPDLVRLFRLLEAEMADLEPIWPLADGLPEPVEDALATAICSPDTTLLVGCIDACVVGFLHAVGRELAPQAGGERVGAVRHIFTEMPAREVGVGEAMLHAFLESELSNGVQRFDAQVTPGHRLTKNFFESHGFSARSIVMHRDPGKGK
jgi:hypothetical protein